MNLPSLSFNTLILAGVVGAFAVAFFAGEGRVKKLAAGSLVGYLAAMQLGQLAQEQLAKVSFVPDASVGTVQLILFGLVAVLFNLGKVHHVEGRPRVSIESVAVGVITCLFVFTSVLGFMGESTRQDLLTNYNLAAQLYSLRLLWLGLTVSGLILIEVMGGNTKRPR